MPLANVLNTYQGTLFQDHLRTFLNWYAQDLDYDMYSITEKETKVNTL